jgi:hypothetical protein
MRKTWLFQGQKEIITSHDPTIFRSSDFPYRIFCKILAYFCSLPSFWTLDCYLPIQ